MACPHPSNFHFFRFVLFKIDIYVESRPSYDTIFQYLLKFNVFRIMITSKGFLAVITGDYRKGGVKNADFLITLDMNSPLIVLVHLLHVYENL